MLCVHDKQYNNNNNKLMELNRKCKHYDDDEYLKLSGGEAVGTLRNYTHYLQVVSENLYLLAQFNIKFI